MRGLFLCMLLTFGSSYVLGTETPSSSLDDGQIEKAAKERSYPGGRDEEDLEVLPQVLKPTRKMGDVLGTTESPTNDDEF